MKMNVISLAMVGILGSLVAGYTKAKWQKISEDNFRGAELLIKSNLLPNLQEFDPECAETAWEIGNAYTKLNYEVATSTPTGRSYFVEIWCPFTEQEMYSLYILWASQLTPQKTLKVDQSSVELFNDLDKVNELDHGLAALVEAETSVFDFADYFNYFVGLFHGLLCYYSELCTTPEVSIEPPSPTANPQADNM